MADDRDLMREMKERLAEWDERIDDLAARARRHTKEGADALKQQIESLTHRRETVRNKLDLLRQSAKDGWDRAASDLDHAWEALKAGWETARSHLESREREGEGEAEGEGDEETTSRDS